MRQYNSNQIYSFKFNDKIQKEIKLTRVYFRRGKINKVDFWAEKTSETNIICVTSDIICNLKQDGCHGFIGDIKEGQYTLQGKAVKLYDAHQVYNGVAYVRYKYIEEEKEMTYISEDRKVITLPVPLGTTLYEPITTCGDFCLNHKELFDKLYPKNEIGRCDRNMVCHTQLHSIRKFVFELSNIERVLNNFGVWIFETEEEAIEKATKIIHERINTLINQGFNIDEKGYGVRKNANNTR